jgi:hypothetical protein
MNRLLIHSNGTGDGYTPAVAATAALTLGAASAAASTALNGSSSGDGGPGSGGNPSGNNNDVRRLQDEVNQLTKRNGGNLLCLIQRMTHTQTHLGFSPLFLFLLSYFILCYIIFFLMFSCYIVLIFLFTYIYIL